MFLFQRLLRAIRVRFGRQQKTNFTLDVGTLHSLRVIATQEERTPEEIATRILDDVLNQRLAQEYYWQRWQMLTPREQEIAALICLNYTTRQIASRLHISPTTVKTHAEHILLKFGVPDRRMLRLILSDWDFSAWGH